MLAKSLKAKLANDELVLGLTLTNHCWPGYLEIIKSSGYDFVWLDCEHSPFTLQQVEEACRVARILQLPVVLRPEACSFHLISRYIDMGPSGILLPHVEDIEQIKTLEQASYLPPKGLRSPGGPCLAWLQDRGRESWNEYERHFLRMIQIESAAAINALPDLLQSDCVDAVMLGPYDLSVSLDHTAQLDSPVVVEAIENVLNICRRHRKPCGMVVGSSEQARCWIDRGFRFVTCGEVVNLLRDQLQSMHDNLRSLKLTGGINDE